MSRASSLGTLRRGTYIAICICGEERITAEVDRLCTNISRTVTRCRSK